jgi:hypothetical protein
LISQFGLPLLVTVVQFAAASLALGQPDAGAALAFLRGGWPSAAETLAALELLVWAIVVAGAAWSLATLGWELAHRAAGSRRFRQGSVLATGLLILVAGAAHHATYQVGMSGGTVEEAQGVLGR